MSTPFYDLASLVVVPSGYKASKVYAQKPLTTDGQLAFTRSTTATRVNSAGLIESVAINVPRLDYTNSTCPKLLLEPSRTNVNEASNDFSNVSYFTSEATRTTGQTDPANGTSATRFLETTVSNNHGFFYVFYTPPTTGTVTQSIFVKDNGRGAVKFGASGQSISFVFTFATGAITNVTGGPSAYSATQYANGFWRLTLSYGVAAGSPINHTFVYGYNGTTTSYAGDVTKGFLAYGAQFEYGAYPTSLINTSGAAVTRGADGNTTLPTAQTLNNFTLFYEGSLLENDNNMLFGSGNSAWYFDITLARIVIDLGSGRKYQAPLTLTANTSFKVLAKRTAGVFEAFLNGVKLTPSIQVTDTLALSLSSIGWGFSSTYYPKMKLDQVLAFQTALSDADCIALTA